MCRASKTITNKFVDINPTLHGGWYIAPPPGSLQKVMDIVKGVPKKIWSTFFEAGVKNQKSKLEPIGLKFCRGLWGPKINYFCYLDHIVLGPHFQNIAI